MPNLLRALSIETGLPEAVVHRIILTAPNRYKSYYIPKRNGGRRLISQPAPEVKLLQRAFVSRYLSKLPIHSAAMAYRPNLSISDNAKVHANSRAILKMDFRDFFPSIRKANWIRYCSENAVFSNQLEMELSSSLLFQRPKGASTMQLAIGAPSSPSLSNILMFHFDEMVTNEVAKHGVKYTRYADDLTFSGGRSWNLVDVELIVRRTIRNIPYPRLELHPNKTVHVTKKYSRTVTGLVLANDGRVTIGKRRKRVIHAATHSALHGRLDDRKLQKLAGLLAFVHSVEPDFIDVLKRRYGAELIAKLQTIGSSDRRNLRARTQSS